MDLLFGFVDLFFRFVVVDLLNRWFYFLGLCLIFEFLVEIKANPSSTRAQYHLTGGFSRSAAGLELLHPIPLGRFEVGHKPDPDQPVDSPTCTPTYSTVDHFNLEGHEEVFRQVLRFPLR